MSVGKCRNCKWRFAKDVGPTTINLCSFNSPVPFLVPGPPDLSNRPTMMVRGFQPTVELDDQCSNHTPDLSL